MQIVWTGQGTSRSSYFNNDLISIPREGRLYLCINQTNGWAVAGESVQPVGSWIKMRIPQECLLITRPVVHLFPTFLSAGWILRAVFALAEAPERLGRGCRRRRNLPNRLRARLGSFIPLSGLSLFVRIFKSLERWFFFRIDAQPWNWATPEAPEWPLSPLGLLS